MSHNCYPHCFKCTLDVKKCFKCTFGCKKTLDKEVEWYEDSINITMQDNMHGHYAIFEGD